MVGRVRGGKSAVLEREIMSIEGYQPNITLSDETRE